MILQLIIAYVGAALAFALLDLIWLGAIAKGYYSSQMGDLKADKFRKVPAVAFYLIMLAGTLYFAIMPAIAQDSFGTAALNGALFGFFCYATYDLTNLATTRDWPAPLTLLDMAWGTLLTMTASVAGYLAAGLV